MSAYRFPLLARPTIAIMSAAIVATGTISVATARDRSPATERAGHPQILHFGIHFSPQNVIDVLPLQQSDGDYRAGDYTVFSDTLTDGHGKNVGTEGGTGVITKVDATGAQINYTLTIEIAGGQITAQGLGSPDPHKHLAITGGTGKYVGARGEVDAIEHGDDTGSLTLTLW
jgi:hypothetical protein